MNERTEQSGKEYKRVFTVAEANATLPLVGAIVADVVSLSQILQDRRQRLAYLNEDRLAEREDCYSQELNQVEADLRNDESRLAGYFRELRELHVLSRKGPDGKMDEIDFPARVDGRVVMLCWRLGESELAYWHALTADFDERQPLSPSLASTD